MLDMTFTSGPIASQIATSTAFTVTFADGDQLIFRGQFTTSNNLISFGTMTEVEVDHPGGTPSFWIDGFSLDAITVIQDYNGTKGNLFEYVFFRQDNGTYIGSSGTDFIFGLTSSGTYIGGSGTETFETASGNNAVTGGSGVDTLKLAGPQAEYTVADNGDGSITVTDTVPTRNGTDHIVNVQFLQFKDKILFDLTPTEARIALLYQGTLGRTPDAAGLVGWEKSFATEPAAGQGADDFTALAGTPVSGLPNLAYGFTQSAEFQQKYGTLTDSQFVTQLYANVLDRTPDTAGLNGWVGALQQGHTREWVLVGFVESAEAYHNAELGYVGQSGTHAPWLMVI
jgi:hypothetical protein